MGFSFPEMSDVAGGATVEFTTGADEMSRMGRAVIP
jgi:hypothetical protein